MAALVVSPCGEVVKPCIDFERFLRCLPFGPDDERGGGRHSQKRPTRTVRPVSSGCDLTPTDDAALIARGDYLAKAADCAGCHTAPKGGAPFAGGLRIGSPFGTIVIEQHHA